MSVIVVAPDSFKGSASAAQIAAAVAAGWATERPGDRIVPAPMADGGEGTLDAFAQAVPGARRHPVRVTGPDGRPVDATWLLLPDGTAVVELAETSGLGRMTALRPFEAQTTGFGEAIAAALAAGATSLLLAIGGSASTDGGAGALAALGARFRDAAGGDIRPGNRGLAELATVDLSGLAPLPAGGARILGDVTNPLLGPHGAAAVFGPQKGSGPEDVPLLDAALRRYAEALTAAVGPGAPSADAPGAGAAGGTGFGLLVWGARMAPGAAAVGEAIGLPANVGAADTVITGEGRFDEQTAGGKVAAYVSALARQARVPALLVAGSIDAAPDGFADSVALTGLAGGPESSLADPLRWGREAGATLARRFAG